MRKEEISNRPIMGKKIETVIKTSQQRKILAQIVFTDEFYQTCKEKLIPLILFQKTEEKETLPN